MTCTMLETVLVTSLNVRYARDRPSLLITMCAILKNVPGCYSKGVLCSRPPLVTTLIVYCATDRPDYYSNVHYTRNRPWLPGSMCAMLKTFPGHYSKRALCSRPSLVTALHRTVLKTVPGYSSKRALCSRPSRVTSLNVHYTPDCPSLLL